MEAPSDPLVRLHAVVEGYVQGVGFRNFVQITALELDLTGWVRNRWDGSVEVVAEGQRLVLEKFLAALERGPRASQVIGVHSKWSDGRGEFSSFSVRMTAG